MYQVLHMLKEKTTFLSHTPLHKSACRLSMTKRQITQLEIARNLRYLHEESVDLIMMAFKTQHVAHLSHNSSNLHSPLMYLSPKDRSCSQSMRDYADYPFSVST
jgi:hypothetical protein